jgi:predicted phosphoribosyltransferase
MKIFANRTEAGRALAEALQHFRAAGPVVVLALPRGGVPVACEVARSLGAPLGLLIVRKIGTPGQPELAMGAVASGGVVIRNADIVSMLGITDAEFSRASDAAQAELLAKEQLYGAAQNAEVAGKTVILVDDGAATGATMRAAVAAAKARRAARVVVALPTSSTDAAAALVGDCDDLVCLATPEPYGAVGYWYRDFTQVGDDEVRRLLGNAGTAASGSRSASAAPA